MRPQRKRDHLAAARPTAEIERRRLSERIACLSADWEEGVVAAGARNGSLSLWTVEGGKKKAVFKGHAAE
eukprot:1189599-Prorocentrum_minimum.AAC.1